MNFDFDPDRTILGHVFTHAGEEELALSELDRMNHMLVVGKTGMGKTTILKNIALQDMHAGHGVGVIDPHGDLAPELLELYPRFRSRDLVYIDPNDEERVVTFNIFDRVPRNKIAVAAANLVASLKAIWGDIGWGARMERIIYFSAAALMEAPQTSLLGMPRLLTSETYRGDILAHVTDPVVHGFFAEQYAIWDDDYRVNAIEPVLNKVETLLASPVLRAMIGNPTSSIDFADIMDNRKVLIANLSKGAIGEGHAHLLGALLVSGFFQAAMARGIRASPTAPPPSRVPFFLCVDEFQNFATDNFGDIASEARKMKLGLLLAHQYLKQASPKLSAAILGNVGSIIAFQLGAADAEAIAPEIGLKEPDPLTQLSLGEVWMKHATYGGPYHPRLLEPIATRSKGRDAALKQNRLRNTFPRARVEAKINRFLRPQQKRRPHLG